MTDVRGSSAQYLQKIVARHVRLVADGDEARDADLEALRVVEDGEPERSALRRHRNGSRRRRDRGKRGVQADSRVRVQQAHAVWTDQAAARQSNAFHQLALARAPLLSTFTESRADDADRANALGDARIDRVQDRRRRYHDDREIDRAWHVFDRRIGVDAVDLCGVRMNGGERTGEAGRDQVVENLRADLAALAVGADDHDRARLEKGLHRRRGGCVRAERRLACHGRGHRERDRDTADTSLHGALDGEARVTKDIEHAAVVAKDLGGKRLDTLRPRDRREPFEELRADPVPLQGVGNSESHFGAIRLLRREVKAGEGNDVAVRFDDQRDATSRVRCGQRHGFSTA